MTPRETQQYAFFRYFIKKPRKNAVSKQFSHISVGLNHQLKPKGNGVTQLLDVVLGELHGPTLLKSMVSLGTEFMFNFLCH
jgi:hypothetical protein